MKITLTKPLNYKDAELDTLELDLDALTGRDLISVEETLRASGQVNLFSQSYFAAVAARAAHIPVEVLETLKAKDFMKLTAEVINFLTDTGSGVSMPESSGE